MVYDAHGWCIAFWNGLFALCLFFIFTRIISWMVLFKFFWVSRFSFVAPKNVFWGSDYDSLTIDHTTQ